MCLPCRKGCSQCEEDEPCIVEYDVWLRGIPLGIQSFTMTITLVVGIVVARLRKTKVQPLLSSLPPFVCICACVCGSIIVVCWMVCYFWDRVIRIPFSQRWDLCCSGDALECLGSAGNGLAGSPAAVCHGMIDPCVYVCSEYAMYTPIWISAIYFHGILFGKCIA